MNKLFTLCVIVLSFMNTCIQKAYAGTVDPIQQIVVERGTNCYTAVLDYSGKVEEQAGTLLNLIVAKVKAISFNFGIGWGLAGVAGLSVFGMDTESFVAIATVVPFWIKDDKCTELSDNEQEKLDNQELAVYKTDIAKFKMSEMKKSIEDKVDTEEFEELKKNFENLTNQRIEAQDDAIEVQGKEIARLKKAAIKDDSEPLSLKEALTKGWVDNADKLKAISGGEHGVVTMELKTEVTRASVSGNTMSFTIPGIGKDPIRRMFMEDLFQSGVVGPDSNGVIRFWDQDTLTRNAAAVAESATIPESEISWIERTQKIEKIGDSIPVTMEALADVGFIEGEINNFLLENVNLKLDRDLLLGTGVSPILEGVDSFAEAYAAGAFALKIIDPNIFDVASTAMTQVSNNGLTNFYASTAIVMHPTDVQLARLTKDTHGNYVMPMWMSSDGRSIEGVPVIATPLVTQNVMYVGDFTKGTVWSTGGLELEIANQHASDWLDDVIRLKARIRKSLVVRNIHQNAFVKVSSISAAITALTKP